MKKKSVFFIFLIPFFVFACSNLSVTNSKRGKIMVQFPSSSSNARSAIVADAEHTAYYKIELEGPTPKSIKAENGDLVSIDELEPGEYTITAQAYSEEDFLLAGGAATAEVKAGETKGVNLTLDKNGIIVINLPISSTAARNAIISDAEHTAYYKITLEGPTQKVVEESGGTVVIDGLLPGIYTVTIEGYSIEGYRISNITKTVEVHGSQTTSMGDIAFKENILANTNFTWWNYNVRSNQNNPYHYTFSAAAPNNTEKLVVGKDLKFNANSTNVIEDNAGRTYFIFYYDSDAKYYLCRLEVDNPSARHIKLCNLGERNIPKIYYDEKNDYIYLVSQTEDSKFSISRAKGESAGTAEENSLSLDSYETPAISGLNSNTPLQMVAIRGNDFYFVTRNGEIDTLYYMEFSKFEAGPTESGGFGTISASSPKRILSVMPSAARLDVEPTGISNVRGEITDITIASDGTAYALICDHSDFSIPEATSFGDSLETPIYSRGAIAKIASDGSVTYLGYHDDVRNLTLEPAVANYIEFNEYYYYYGSLKLYAPNKTQSSAEFYGPQKIIAKKPDELYIVDCGVNFMLAGYNPDNPAHDADSTKQDESGYHSGNAFIHNRVVKVDLKSFALSQIVDHVVVNSYKDGSSVSANTNDIFGCVNISITFANDLGYSGHFLCGPATLEDEE